MRLARTGTLALFAGSCFLCAAVAEIAARVARARNPESISARYTERDPVRGWRHRPGARGRFGAAEYVINSHGLRDVERPVPPPARTERVLILGDSFAEGFSVSLADAVPQALERELRGHGCAVEVVGGGTVGYSTDQEYLFYRDEGAAYGARTVVLLFYYNDVLYNARGAAPDGAPKPLFSFVGGHPHIKNYPLPARTCRPAAAPWRGSAALAWVRGRLRKGAPSVYDALAWARFWPAIRPGDVPQEMEIYLRDQPPAMVQAWQQTEHLLALLAAEARSHGARLMIAHVPSKMEVSGRDWKLTARWYRVDERTFDRRRVARLLEDAGRRLEIPVLDLTGALYQADAGRSRGPYFEYGGHWNALGHSVAAHEIAAALGRARWLSCAARSR
jgi:lysophospholipase L1-like esterase